MSSLEARSFTPGKSVESCGNAARCGGGGRAGQRETTWGYGQTGNRPVPGANGSKGNDGRTNDPRGRAWNFKFSLTVADVRTRGREQRAKLNARTNRVEMTGASGFEARSLKRRENLNQTKASKKTEGIS